MERNGKTQQLKKGKLGYISKQKDLKKKAKVLLIQPPQLLLKNTIKRCVPPLGMAYIAAVLERDNFDVKILDAYVEGYNNEKPSVEFILVGLDWQEISGIVKNFDPQFVGISGMFDN